MKKIYSLGCCGVKVIYQFKDKAEKLYAWHWKEWKKQFGSTFGMTLLRTKDNITVNEWYRSFSESLICEINGQRTLC